MTPARWQTWVVVAANLAPLVLLSSGALDLPGLLLAYVVETAIGVTSLARTPRILLLAACLVAAVLVIRDLDGSIGNIIVATLTGLVLAVVLRLTRNTHTTTASGVARAVARLAVVAAGLALTRIIGDYERLDRSGWEPAMINSGLSEWWTTVSSSTTAVIAELSDLFGIPPAASPAILLIAFMTFNEAWATWHDGQQATDQLVLAEP